MALLELCLIVKDSGERIVKALESWKEYIDYWTILDTGSTDGTQRRIKKILKDVPGQLYEEPYENFTFDCYNNKDLQQKLIDKFGKLPFDFAKARNRSLELCSRKCHFIITIDDTYQIVNPKLLRKKLTNIIDKPHNACLIYIHNQDYGKPETLNFVQSLRIIRSNKDFKWVNSIHELLDVNEMVPNITLNNDTYIWDEIDSYHSERSYNRHKRDIEVLTICYDHAKELKAKARYAYYAAQTSIILNDDKLCEKWLKTRINIDKEPSNDLYHVLTQYARYTQNRTYSDDAIEMFPNRVEAYLESALIAYKSKNYNVAYAYLRHALFCHDSTTDKTLLFIAMKIDVYVLIAKLALRFGHNKDAVNYIKTGLQFNSKDNDLLKLANSCKRLNMWEDDIHTDNTQRIENKSTVIKPNISNTNRGAQNSDINRGTQNSDINRGAQNSDINRGAQNSNPNREAQNSKLLDNIKNLYNNKESNGIKNTEDLLSKINNVLNNSVDTNDTNSNTNNNTDDDKDNTYEEPNDELSNSEHVGYQQIDVSDLPFKRIVFATDSTSTGQWDGNTSNVRGSETSIINIVNLLAKMTKEDNSPKYEVIVFCNTVNKNKTINGVIWRDVAYLEQYLKTNIIDHFVSVRSVKIINLLNKYIKTIRNHYFWIHDIGISDESLCLSQIAFRKMIYVSEYQKSLFMEQFSFPESLCQVIPNGINLVDIPTSKIKNTFIYSSDANRGLYELLEVFPIIRKVLPNAQLHIYCDLEKTDADVFSGEYRNVCLAKLQKIRKMVKKHNYIILHGRCSKDELYRGFALAEYWFYPCTFLETFCITALEAQYFKCKVICNDLGALKDVVKSGITYKHTINLHDIMGRIVKYLTKTDHDWMLDEGHEWACKHSYDNIIERWADLFSN